jgi:hypothetical protein
MSNLVNKVWETHFGNSPVIAFGDIVIPFFEELTTECMNDDIGKTIHFRKPLFGNEYDELVGIITGVNNKEYLVLVDDSTFSIAQQCIIEIC